MSTDIRNVKDMTGLITYFAEKLQWNIDPDDFDDIEDVAYDFEAEDIGLKEEAFARINSLLQLPPLVDGQKWGIFCVEFDSRKFEVTALRKILSGLIPKRRNSADHAVWEQKDLLFLCFWGKDNDRTIGIAHFEDKESGLPTIKMISCAPAVEDFTQIRVFEDRLKRLQWPMNYVDYEKWREDWSNAFTTGYRQTIQDASTLTTQLAAEAQEIRNRILEILNVETVNGYVHLLYEKFKNTLIHDMTETQFADMYAQTVVYGLFSARCMDDTEENFSPSEAVECIPNTNPFLKSLMQECLGAKKNSKLSFDELEIGNVVDLLLHTKTSAIIQDFNRQTGGGREDPVIHFYEEFLTAYDKKQKVARGVYYTPQPVVNYIVRKVDNILKTEFGFENGLASIKTKKIKYLREAKKKSAGKVTKGMVEDTKDVFAIQILDPATGTGTFIRQTILQIYENLRQQNKGVNKEDFKKLWNEYVPKYLLPRINAFELMMAPYAVAHMKLAMVLKDTGYNFIDSKRLNVFLTNTLEKPGESDTQFTLWNWQDPLSAESLEANRAKKNPNINIVIGNPPYLAASTNPYDISAYKTETDGVTDFKERKHWLNDDYVKFFRFAEQTINNNKEGIVAYVSNNGYLDNPTFRGMRGSLLRTFDKIWIVNLHGSANKRETTPDGGKDENVFDIMQGISLFIGTKTTMKKEWAEVYYADVWGTRNEKLKILENGCIHFKQLTLDSNMAYFIPFGDSNKSIYERGVSIADLFPKKVTGIITGNDKVAIASTKNELIRRMDIVRTSTNDKPIIEMWGKFTAGQTPEKIRSDIVMNEGTITPIAFRPFDNRWTYYSGNSCAWIFRPREKSIMGHLLKAPNSPVGENIGIVFCKTSRSFFPPFVSKNIIAHRLFSALCEITYIAPLYLCSGNGTKNDNWTANIDSNAYYQLTKNMSNRPTPIEIFDYVYGILHDPAYREKYEQYLNRDYPRVPVINDTSLIHCGDAFFVDEELFFKYASVGKKLRKLHLMETTENADLILETSQHDKIEIETIKYKKGILQINKETKIHGITPEAWAYNIGGHQVLDKWFKEHKGEILSKKTFSHVTKIVGIINETLRMEEYLNSLH